MLQMSYQIRYEFPYCMSCECDLFLILSRKLFIIFLKTLWYNLSPEVYYSKGESQWEHNEEYG